MGKNEIHNTSLRTTVGQLEMTDTDRIACRKAVKEITAALIEQFEFNFETDEEQDTFTKGIHDTVLEHVLPLMKAVRDEARRVTIKSKPKPKSGSSSGSGSSKKSHRPNYYAMLHKIFSPKAAGGYDYLFEGRVFKYQPDKTYLKGTGKKPQMDFYDKVHSADHHDLLTELSEFESSSIADVVIIVEKTLESLGQKSAQMVRTAVIWHQFMDKEWRDWWIKYYKDAVENDIPIEPQKAVTEKVERKPKSPRAKAVAKAKPAEKPEPETKSESEPETESKSETESVPDEVYDATTEEEEEEEDVAPAPAQPKAGLRVKAKPHTPK